MYHGAEHKCINCLERGKELTVKNVKRSSRLHKRCGTSFMFFVLFVSIILFFFIRVDNPVRVTGDRETSANLRYKTGRNLMYNAREVYEVTRPEDIQLPSGRLTSSYIFAYNRDFLVYNNDANKYIRYYKNTFQHGGISMEEMMVPFVVLKPKKR